MKPQVPLSPGGSRSPCRWPLRFRVAGWHDAEPGTGGDLAVLFAVVAALVLEAVLLRRVWVSRAAGAHPVRLALALAVAVLSLGMAWRLRLAMPGYLQVVLSGEPGAILAHRHELLVLLACAVCCAAGLWHGVTAGIDQCGRLAWHAAGGSLRRRARSDLYGSARFMTRGEMLGLHEPGSSQNIILGEVPGPGRRLMQYRLHGSITTFAPPRTGKTALVIQNLLDPHGTAWHGSTVTMDPPRQRVLRRRPGAPGHGAHGQAGGPVRGGPGAPGQRGATSSTCRTRCRSRP